MASRSLANQFMSTESSGPDESSAHDLLSPIESLPQELVFKIIDFVPEAVLNLMATSPTLQCRVREYALQHVTIPIVDRLGISRNFSWSGGRYTWIWMHVPKPLANLFELRLKIRERPPTMRIKRLFHEYSFQPNNHYRYELDTNVEYSATIGYLRGAFGNQVNEATCDTLLAPCATMLLDGVKIGRLEMTIDNLSGDIASQILKRIEMHECTQLKITMKDVTASDNAIQFLLDLSSLVRSIRIVQCEVSGISEDAKFLLGSHDVDWSRVILEMFSTKVDKILIDTHYKGYLTKRGVDFLREKLPNFGDKVWFETDCIAYETDISYVKDGLSVAFDADDQRLRMKHSLRTEELF